MSIDPQTKETTMNFICAVHNLKAGDQLAYGGTVAEVRTAAVRQYDDAPQVFVLMVDHGRRSVQVFAPGETVTVTGR